MECLLEDMARIFEAGDEKPSMYQVEFLGISPFIFYILDFELAISWGAARLSNILFLFGKGFTDKFGWIGLRSLPITVADGYLMA